MIHYILMIVFIGMGIISIIGFQVFAKKYRNNELHDDAVEVNSSDEDLKKGGILRKICEILWKSVDFTKDLCRSFFNVNDVRIPKAPMRQMALSGRPIDHARGVRNQRRW